MKISDLCALSFAPFGDVVAFDEHKARTANDGSALRADTAAKLENSKGAPVLAIYRVERQELPLRVTLLEHHPHSSQAFIALSVPRFLIVVAPANPFGLPDMDGAQAFVGKSGQGINYRPGVWHAPITALDQSGDFLMLMWERGAEDDCIVHRSPIAITIEP